ncbi:MAG TPA: pirin family protein [Lacibacter sp.]|nr:pirin family protein [Lacibacter sp.]HMO90505.1 pirin family protein [Lacibacter sp.]
MQTVYHPAASRGHAQHGWLNSYHTFSFGGYYNPERIHFGALRVLNDDTVAPGMGFGTHPHDNMEIISIPLRGDLKHRDSMGNEAVIREGDIQVMSAGSGIAHSEMNANRDKEVKFLQIWVFPNRKEVQPRYGQLTMDPVLQKNNLAQVLSPDPNDEGVWIHQDAWFHMGRLDAGISREYQLRRNGNGVYVFVLDGTLTIGGQELQPRDGLGITGTAAFTLTATSNARVLLMEVPLQVNA